MKKNTLLLIGLIIIQSAISLFWLTTNKAEFPWDPSGHAAIALAIYNDLISFQFNKILVVSGYYPIFIHTLTAFILLLAGIHLEIFSAISTIFYLLTICVLYLYTNLLFKSSRVALLSATLFSLFPIVSHYSHFYILDIPLIFFVVLSAYLLEKTRNFQNIKYTVIFFICLGIMMMTKWTGFVFILIFIFTKLWRAIEEKRLNVAI